MKRLVTAAAFLTLALSTTLYAQRWGNDRPSGYAPYGFVAFTNTQQATLRLDITPGDANVFVDARYMGRADSFSSAFQRLPLAGGPHVIEIRKEGFTSLAIDIAVYPGQNVTFSRRLQPAAGDASGVELVPPQSDAELAPDCNGPAGAVRLDVTPKDADVYADGYYVGRVDDFNGSQHLLLTQDRHHLVLKKDGFDTMEFNLTIASDRPALYRAALKKRS